MQRFMIFDVESIGLHGEGFAVGFVVTDVSGKELESGYAACHPSKANGDPDDRTWVRRNVVPSLPEPTHATPLDVRIYFWSKWLEHKAQGAILWAECGWPVEANFLSACIADDPEPRKWAGPYPLHEVATLMLANDIDPIRNTVVRLPNELPAHNPLSDARLTSRTIQAFLRMNFLDTLEFKRDASVE